jgi:hypothetical protein
MFFGAKNISKIEGHLCVNIICNDIHPLLIFEYLTSFFGADA